LVKNLNFDQETKTLRQRLILRKKSKFLVKNLNFDQETKTLRQRLILRKKSKFFQQNRFFWKFVSHICGINCVFHPVILISRSNPIPGLKVLFIDLFRTVSFSFSWNTLIVQSTVKMFPWSSSIPSPNKSFCVSLPRPLNKTRFLLVSQKSKLWPHVWQLWSKIEIIFKNRNFDQKSKFLTIQIIGGPTRANI